MSRIRAIDPNHASGKTAQTLAAIHRTLGVTPNLYRVAANSPAVLQALVGLGAALSQGTLTAAVREALAITVAELNGCDYCLSAHTALASGAGLSEREIERARLAASPDPRTDAILKFARAVVVERGRVGQASLDELARAGLDDAVALEIIGNVVANVFTNYLNLVADTDIDFPVMRTQRAA